jgi:hypothetical protein
MKKLLLPVVLCLAWMSCSPPPFDLTLSLSARTAKALTLEGTVGPVDKMNIDQPPQNAVFYPGKSAATGLDLQDGFLLYARLDGRWLAFVTGDATGTYRKLDGELSAGASPGGRYPDIIAHQFSDPVLHRIGGFKFDAADPHKTGYTEIRADISGEQVAPVFSFQPSSVLAALFGVTGTVIGISVPSSSSPPDTAYFLARQDGTGKSLEYGMTMVPAGLAFAGATHGFSVYDLSQFGVPLTVDRVQYFYNPAAARSFLSWYDASTGQNRWRCWTWSNVTAGSGGELVGVDSRIDALLSTGELFSTEDDTGRVYGSDGVLLAAFPLTGLTFIDERSVNGTVRMIFSQSLFYGRRPSFNIYSIPTADLKSLASK